VFDLRLLLRGAALIALLVAAAGGVAEAALSAITGGATVDEWAVRGDVIAPSYVVPVADVERAGWGDTHAAYPATDVFVGCGAELVSPVSGTVLEVRRVNAYDPAVDNPATRGGRSVAILGEDGVRYYLAHFDTIVDDLEPGDTVTGGQPLGTMGDTGRTSACHLHFSISPPCPGREWSVRRGVIWPYPYLDAWRRGEQRSPVDEVEAWAAANPNACAEAMADPFAADA
jgi:murein DD-endopeptidase MepM/ murein hydrolase activator NlpD